MRVFRKLLALLEPVQLRSAYLLLGLMLIGMVLETLGVGVVVPVLALMTDVQLANKYPIVYQIYDFFGNPDRVRLISGGVMALVGVYALKVGFLAYLSFKQAQFTFGLDASLSQRMYAGYLGQPYTFHMQRNSAHLIRNVTTEVSQFSTAVTAASLLVTESLVLLGIGGLLVLAEPLGAFLVMSALGLAGYSFYFFTKGRVLRWGKARQYHEGQRIQRLQQGLGGIKDVKLLGREREFVKEYAQHNNISSRIGRHLYVLQAMPRLWLELLAIIGLAVLVLSMLTQGKPIESLIPTLGLFAAAAFRLMPSVNRFLNGTQTLRYNLPVINTLYEEKHLFNDSQFSNHIGVLPFEQKLQLKAVSYAYPSSPKMVLTDIDINIIRGTTVGFIGSSGAGKSTLIDLMLGLLTPDCGQVLVDNIDIRTDMRGWQNQIGYVPQDIYLTDDTIRRNVALGLPEDQIDDQAVRAAIKSAQLNDFVDQLPDGLNTVVGERGVRLSGGQCQRIGIARALYRDPPVLVLDEASSSLDTSTEKAVMESVNALRHSKTILIIAHRLSTVSNCDVLYRIEHGRAVLEVSSVKAH